MSELSEKDDHYDEETRRVKFMFCPIALEILTCSIGLVACVAFKGKRDGKTGSMKYIRGGGFLSLKSSFVLCTSSFPLYLPFEHLPCRIYVWLVIGSATLNWVSVYA